MNKLLSLPEFKKGINFRQQSPKDGNYKYKYVLLKHVTITFEHPITSRGQCIKFFDSKDNIWAMISYDKFIIFKDYAWDGCTPKKWWGMWWGTPDFEETILASLVHDVMLQFMETKHFPFNRLEIDNYFKCILDEQDFTFSKLYYAGVRFGSKMPQTKYNTHSKLTTIPKD